METNALNYTGYYFNIARGAQTYEDLEDDIEAIADECVFYGGPAVIEARAMMRNFDHSLLRYEWVDTCATPSSKTDEQREANTTNVAKEKSYLLVPNFYAGSRSGSITLGINETGELLVYSVDGRLLADYELVEGENGIDLTIIGKVKGMYLYKIYINGNLEHTDKIIIIE